MTTNTAKQAFEIPNKGGSSSDYLKNKKSKLMYCNRSGHCNNKLVSSYAEKNIIQNGRNLETPVDSITFHLYSNLDTQLNYTGIRTIVDLSSGLVGAINNSIVPLYKESRIDPDGSMFGSTVCAANNLMNYRVPYLPQPNQTVYKN